MKEFDGELPPWIQVVFCNTGDELPETYDFVQAFTDKLGVKITWLERAGEKTNLPARLKLVDYDMAARNGEPFDAMLIKKKRLPNVVQRACTSDLKVSLSHAYARGVLGWKKYSKVIGFRGDEIARFIKLFECDKKGRDSWKREGLPPQCPMVRASVSNAIVKEFWKDQPWRLEIESWEGNCSGCFLKGTKILVAMERKRPGVLNRMRDRERLFRTKVSGFKKSAQFDKERTYEEIIRIARSQIDIEDIEDDRVEDCNCHD